MSRDFLSVKDGIEYLRDHFKKEKGHTARELTRSLNTLLAILKPELNQEYLDFLADGFDFLCETSPSPKLALMRSVLNKYLEEICVMPPNGEVDLRDTRRVWDLVIESVQAGMRGVRRGEDGFKDLQYALFSWGEGRRLLSEGVNEQDAGIETNTEENGWEAEGA